MATGDPQDSIYTDINTSITRTTLNNNTYSPGTVVYSGSYYTTTGTPSIPYVYVSPYTISTSSQYLNVYPQNPIYTLGGISTSRVPQTKRLNWDKLLKENPGGALPDRFKNFDVNQATFVVCVKPEEVKQLLINFYTKGSADGDGDIFFEPVCAASNFEKQNGEKSWVYLKTERIGLVLATKTQEEFMTDAYRSEDLYVQVLLFKENPEDHPEVVWIHESQLFLVKSIDNILKTE